jgi:hypothetical protein
MIKIKLTVLLLLILNIVLSSQNWLPLEAGNTWHFTTKYSQTPYNSPWSFHYNFNTIKVTDSVYIDNKKYYKINNFLGYAGGSQIRYDSLEQKIFIYINNLDYILMDFTLPDGSIFQQIQPDNTLKYVTVKSATYNSFTGELNLKGFNRPLPLYYQYGSRTMYFCEGLGFVCEFEEPGSYRYKADIIEYLLFNESNDSLYNKHTYIADIQFNPILLLENSDTLSLSFVISHPLSVKSNSLYGIGGRSYIQKVLFNSFYTNSTDTIYNSDRVINFNSEVDFSFKFVIDTNKYNQGYYLYYKMIAEDKGLVKSYYSSPDTGYYKLFWKDSSTTKIDSENEMPISFALHQNYPNPFNPSTVIAYQLPAACDVTLKVFDVLGREITTLVNEYKDAGYHEVEFQLAVGGRQYASGIYFYQLRAGNYIATKKMMVVK